MNCRLLQEWRTSLQINKVLQAQSSDLGSCLVQHARREINPGYVLHLQGKAQQQVRLAQLPARARFPPAVCCNACMPQRSSTWCLPRPGVTCSKWQSGAVERSGGDPAGYCTVACPKGLSEVVCREATQIGPVHVVPGSSATFRPLAERICLLSQSAPVPSKTCTPQPSAHLLPIVQRQVDACPDSCLKHSTLSHGQQLAPQVGDPEQGGCWACV